MKLLKMKEKEIRDKGSFLRDAVFAASDGIVTTFAIVAGSVGAALSAKVILALGFANLFADGISMSSGTYLGVKSKLEFEKNEGEKRVSEASPTKQAVVTFITFALGGLFPLLPYLFSLRSPFYLSSILVVASLFAIGMLRSVFTRKSMLKSGFETLLIGGLAAMVAYIVGDLVDKLI